MRTSKSNVGPCTSTTKLCLSNHDTDCLLLSSEVLIAFKFVQKQKNKGKKHLLYLQQLVFLLFLIRIKFQHPQQNNNTKEKIKAQDCHYNYSRPNTLPSFPQFHPIEKHLGNVTNQIHIGNTPKNTHITTLRFFVRILRHKRSLYVTHCESRIKYLCDP